MFIWKVVFFISVWKSVPAASLALNQSSQGDSTISKTVFSCEHNELHLSCEEGRIIHIIRANYGRLTRDLCNDDGQVKWSGENCTTASSYLIITERCEGKQRCSISASNSVFGDPCPGTIKYLEVQYVCVSASSVTSTTVDYSKLNNTSASVLGSVPDTTLDSSFSKTANSCEHNVLHLGCVESGVIHIIRASYGRSVRDLCNDDGQVVWSGERCASSESLKIMSQRCENKEKCSVSASNSVFGDPCVGTIKYLEVQYICVSPSSVTSTTEDYSKLNSTSASVLGSVPDTTLDSSFSKTAYSCEKNVLHLGCVESGVIHLIRASYGRSVRDLCNDDGQVVWSGGPCASSESLKIMSQRCENKERCSVSASNSVFGDPCVGTIKYLEVQYICVSPSSVTSTTEDYSKLNNTSATVLGSVPDTTLDSGFSKTAYACENNVLHLGCVESGVIHIIRANYGRLTRNVCNDDGQVVWSGDNCTSVGSFFIMAMSCEDKQKCSMSASNYVFGDPCHGTIKYLEVEYVCLTPINFASTTDKYTISTSSTPSDPGSKKVAISSLPYYLLLRNYINLNIYYDQEQRKNKETKIESDDSDFGPKWNNCNKLSCLNDKLSKDESVKNDIDSILPQNSNLSPAPQDLSIDREIFRVEDILKENEIGDDIYLRVQDPESLPPGLMAGKYKETANKLIENKKNVSSKRCEDVIKHAKHYLQHLKSTEVEDVEEAYGHYISETLRSIVDPKEREMARIELQKVLMKYRFAKEPE